MSSEADRSKETIQWNNAVIPTNVPQAAYGRISEKLRHAIPEEKVCSMFCGGRKCKYCTPDSWKDEQMAIKGLYSAWVTDNILATARPCTDIIEKYKIVEQFQKNGINSIINLQTPGEHSSCGGPKEAEGFSYVPQTFMDNDVFFYNFGWRDYSVGSLSIILDMVKVMQFAISEGKVAVHCHAGLGRTGVMIACYLVFANRMTANDAIHYIREKRPGAIQTRSQIICIQEFAQYLKPLYIIFSSVDGEAYDFSLIQYLMRQKLMLHGFEARRLKYLPKICFVVCERLLELAQRGKYCEQEHDTISLIKENAPKAFNNSKSNGDDSPSIKSVHSVPDLAGRQSLTPMTDRSISVDPRNAPAAEIQRSRSPNIFSRNGTQNSLASSSDGLDSSGELSHSNSYGDLLSQQLYTKNLRWFPNGVTNQNDIDPFVKKVAQALSVSEYDEDVLEEVERYKVLLNTENAWNRLEKEDNPLVLAALMMDWLDHLKEPVLQMQDLQHMLSHAEEPVVGLHKLNKGAKQTTEYLIGVIVRLSPLPEEIEMEILQRMLSTLTHQNMILEDSLLSSPKNTVRRTLNTAEMQDSLARKMVYFFLNLLNSLQRKLWSLEEETQQ